MITEFGKNKVVQSYNESISKIRLNETIIVETFDVKSSIGDTLTIEFIVPDGIQQISKLETLDTDNNVLSVSSLYVSISNDTRFKYQVKVGD
ncbi:MAG: hypothetical protein L0I48_05315 [Lactococcus plantarum]|nr:hypothetical protein [Lactococcus plantarum]MDN6084359.1 hypothetical protein [Lactococcus plantarum]